MITDEVVEAGAKQMLRDCDALDRLWDELDEETRDLWKGYAKSIIAAARSVEPQTGQITDEAVDIVYLMLDGKTYSKQTMRIALEAGLSAVMRVQVSVKSLEWTRSVMPPFIASARTPVGSYRVEIRGSNGWWWMFSGSLGDEGHASEEDAKAAAQADYSARILSTLSISPAPVDGGEPTPSMHVVAADLADTIRRGIKDQGYGYTLKGDKLTVSSDEVFAIDIRKLADFIIAATTEGSADA